jgi:hypothetical protein
MLAIEYTTSFGKVTEARIQLRSPDFGSHFRVRKGDIGTFRLVLTVTY